MTSITELPVVIILLFSFKISEVIITRRNRYRSDFDTYQVMNYITKIGGGKEDVVYSAGVRIFVALKTASEANIVLKGTNYNFTPLLHKNS